MSIGEIKTDLFPDRLRAGRRVQGKYEQNERKEIHKNVVISVETVGDDQIIRRKEKSEIPK